MAHYAKFNKAACGHMFKHYERAKDEKGEYIKFGNQDIDTTKSHMNYNLAAAHQNGQGNFVRERCSSVKMQNRADVNVMCSWVVTAPKEIRADETERFFKEAYNFLSDRYGKENVVSAYVHMDEVTPHMHFAFVPVVMDKKKNIFKVSAKEAVTRQDLQTFHKDLSGYMEKVFGRDIGILNEATKEGNKSIEELKRGTAQQELEELTRQAEEAGNKIIGFRAEAEKLQTELDQKTQGAFKIVSKAQEAQRVLPTLEEEKSGLEGKIKALQDELRVAQAEYESKKAFIAECDKASDISMAMPEYAKVHKSVFGKETVTVPIEKWTQKHVSADEKAYLKKATEKFEENFKAFKYTASAEYLRELQRTIDSLKDDRQSLLKTVSSLKNENNSLSSKMDKVNRTLNELPTEVTERFMKAFNELDKTQNKSRDHSR